MVHLKFRTETVLEAGGPTGETTRFGVWRPSSELQSLPADQHLPARSLCGGLVAPYAVSGPLDWGDDVVDPNADVSTTVWKPPGD